MAARAAYHENFPAVFDDTYIIVLSCSDDLDSYADRLTHWTGDPSNWIGEEPIQHLIAFWEPDLDDRMTAIAVLNPPSNLFKHLPLFSGGGDLDGN